jgi:hypothetical protein
MRKTARRFVLVIALSGGAIAQQQPTSQPPLPPGYSKTQPQQPQQAPKQQTNQQTPRYLGPPVSIYDPVQQAAQATAGDLGKLRIDKWKTDGSSKQQAQEMAQSITRNLNSALPDILQQARAASGNLGPQFKLYHDLTAIYETFSTLTDAASSFGQRADAEALLRDLNALDQARRSLADYIQNLAAQNDAQVAQLRTQLAQAQQSLAAQQQKKVIVDDQQPAPTKKKGSTKKKAAATAQTPPKQPPQQ